MMPRMRKMTSRVKAPERHNKKQQRSCACKALPQWVNWNYLFERGLGNVIILIMTFTEWLCHWQHHGATRVPPVMTTFTSQTLRIFVNVGPWRCWQESENSSIVEIRMRKWLWMTSSLHESQLSAQQMRLPHSDFSLLEQLSATPG
jgi:hypothetical protein